MPWRDRDGRLSLLRLLTLAVLCLPGLLTLQAWMGDALGPEPLRAAMKETGQHALYILLASLLVTPARQVLRLPQIVPLRRMIGVGACLYAVAHLLLYAAYQNGVAWRIASEIVLRPYLTIGFLALLMLVALAVTSTDGAVQRLGGARWRRLHRLAYVAAALGVVHFVLHAKSDIGLPVTMLGFHAWLMAYRVVAPKGAAPGAPALVVLALGAAVLTAALEFAWYGIATGIDPWRVLAANLDWYLAPRPAAVVLAAALVAPFGRLLRRGRAPRQPSSRSPGTAAGSPSVSRT